jgi:hypothetical protein
MAKGRSRTENEVPLYLLPQAVARRIREWGEVVYRISIVRTRWHHYNVTVRTRRIKKELAPAEVAVLDALPGTGCGKKHHAARKGRGCAV